MNIRWRPILIGSIIALPLAAGCRWYAGTIYRRVRRLGAMRNEIAMIEHYLPEKQPPQNDESLSNTLLDFHAQNFADVLQTVTNGCTKFNVKNASINTGAAVQSGQFTQVPISVTFTGPLGSAFEFMERLHQNDAVIRLQQLAITREPLAASDSLTVSMQLDAFTSSDGEPP